MAWGNAGKVGNALSLPWPMLFQASSYNITFYTLTYFIPHIPQNGIRNVVYSMASSTYINGECRGESAGNGEHSNHGRDPLNFEILALLNHPQTAFPLKHRGVLPNLAGHFSPRIGDMLECRLLALN